MPRCAIPEQTGDDGAGLTGLTGGPGIDVDQPAPGSAVVAVTLSDDPGQVLSFDADGQLLGLGGAAGPPGPPGGAYAHTQATPATVWTITHDLGYDPGGVLVITTDGDTLDDYGVQVMTRGAVLRLSFDLPFSGTAYLS